MQFLKLLSILSDANSSNWAEQFWRLSEIWICNFLKTLKYGFLYRVRREKVYTRIIDIVLNCMKGSELCNMAMERQSCELSEYVQFLKLGLLIKCADWFKQGLKYLVYAEVRKVGIKKSTILTQSLWNLVKIINSWVCKIAWISAWILGKNCEFFIIECKKIRAAPCRLQKYLM